MRCSVSCPLPRKPTPAPKVLLTWAHPGVRAHCPRAGPCLVGAEGDRQMHVRSPVCHRISTLLYGVPGPPSGSVESRAPVGAGLPCLPVSGCVCERPSADGSPWWLSWAGAGWTTGLCAGEGMLPTCVSGWTGGAGRHQCQPHARGAARYFLPRVLCLGCPRGLLMQPITAPTPRWSSPYSLGLSGTLENGGISAAARGRCRTLCGTSLGVSNILWDVRPR